MNSCYDLMSQEISKYINREEESEIPRDHYMISTFFFAVSFSADLKMFFYTVNDVRYIEITL